MGGDSKEEIRKETSSFNDDSFFSFCVHIHTHSDSLILCSFDYLFYSVPWGEKTKKEYGNVIWRNKRKKLSQKIFVTEVLCCSRGHTKTHTDQSRKHNGKVQCMVSITLLSSCQGCQWYWFGNLLRLLLRLLCHQETLSGIDWINEDVDIFNDLR